MHNFRWKQPSSRIPADSTLKIGEIYNPADLLYSVDKTYLTMEGRDSADKWVSVIKRNPDKLFEIAVHTEERGALKYAIFLSRARAQAVYDYLVKVGKIPAENLSYKGYGWRQLLDKKGNTTNTVGTSKNERTELRVIGKKEFIDSAVFRKNYKAFYKGKMPDVRHTNGDLPSIIKMPEIQFALRPYPGDKDSINVVGEFIKSHPDYYFEIASHTDSRGKAAANYILSMARARGVYDYLIKELKVDPCQVTYAGYGSTCLLASAEAIKKVLAINEKEVLHQRNRRTELRVIGKRN